jgi:hypothetical protein
MQENGAGGKGDTLPEEWFADKDKDYLERHLIPSDPDLWKLERFEDFIDARKQLLRDRFKSLSVLPNTDYAAQARAELRKSFELSSNSGEQQ